MDHFVPILSRIFINHKMLKFRVLSVLIFFFGILYLSAQTQPVVTVRFANPRFNCATNEYCLDVEFQSNTASQSLFGMNVRFFYDDGALEFVNFRNFQGGYSAVAPNPPAVITGPPGSGSAFNFAGTAEYVNGAVQLTNESVPAVVISTTGWTKLYEVCFTVDGTPNTSNFCPSIVWDLESDPNLGGYSSGSDGVVITVVDPSPQFDSAPAIENVVQFNWQYAGSGAAPFGLPNSTSCISIDVPAPVVGTITQPICTTPTGSVVLSGLPSGNWTITRTPGNVTTTGNTASTTISGLPPNATYTFTVTNVNNCTSPASANVGINAIPANPTLGGATAVCVGSTANVTPGTGGTWMSSNTAIATVTSAGVVTGVSAGTVTLTFTETATGCFSTRIVTVNALPSAPIVGTITQPTCTTPTGSVVLSGLPSGNWTITRTPGNVTTTGNTTSTTISGLPVSGTYTFTVTNANNCTSLASANVVINAIPANPTLGGATEVCVNSTANVTPGTGGTWMSSNTAIATVTNAGVVTGVSAGTVTLTFTETATGCFSTSMVTVNALPSAPIVGTITQPTCTTPTGSVVLSGLPSGNWTITRTPGNVTTTGNTTSTTISGLPVSGTYTFTVTNANNCTSLASADVVINAIPANPILGGATEVCVGSTANVTPGTGGAWMSSNTAIATVTSAGVVTGVSAGTVTLTFTETATGCFSTRMVTVNALPSAPIVGTITQPTCTTPTGSVVLSGLPSGNWTITRTPGNVTTTGNTTSTTISGLPVSGTYTFTVTNSNNCTSPASANVVINAIPANPTLGGATEVCVSSTANVTPGTGGTWMSSNTAIATVTSAGVVTGVSAGTVTLTFTETATGCFSTRMVTVNALPSAPIVGTITQPICTTPTGSVVLSGLPSGNWTITRTPGNVTTTGNTTSTTISGLAPNATYTFTVTNANNCTSPASTNVGINAIPANPILGGATAVCVGSTANVTPGTGGTWMSSNTAVATVTNAGVVTGVSAGTVTLTFTETATGCFSTSMVTVNALPSAPIVGTITQPTCTTPTGSVVLSGLPSGNWTITRTPGNVVTPGNTTSTTISGLPVSGTYTFTVTNSNNCTSPASANVEINAIPANPILGGATAVCVGSTANVTPGTGGTWISSNTAIATVTSAGVVTGVSAGTVTLTFTETATGCFSTRMVTVNALPSAPIVGTITQPTCTTPTGFVVLSGLPSGNWTITRTPGNVTTTGNTTSTTISGLPVSGTYTFTVTNANNCTSPASANVEINAIPANPILGGATAVCVGSTANVTPGTGGTWISSNTAIATVTNAGVVTGVSAGTVTLTFTETATGCFSSSMVTVNALPSAPIVGTITQPTCTTPSGSVVLSGLPSGNWTITRTPGNVTTTGNTTSTTISGLPVSGTYTFTVTDANLCTSPASANVGINAIPANPILGGATAVCVGSTANVTPGTGGTWMSSNTAIATVTSAGVVTGVSAGTVTLTFTETATGCSSTRMVTVNALPSAPIVGTITQPTCTTPTGFVVLSGLPSGNWTITRTPGNVTTTGNTTSTTISGLAPNATYTFTVTNANNCTSPASANVEVNAIPANPTLGGATEVCVGSTANVTPGTGGTWMSSNTAIATVTNAGVVTGVSAGTVTLTFTETATGCSSTSMVTVNALPSAPIVGTITQPTCTTPTGSVVLSGLPSGNWTITRTPGNVTTTGNTTSTTISGLPVSGTYTFTVTNANNCTSPASANVEINAIPANPILGGATAVCVGSTANVTPGTGGTWMSSNTAIATVTSAGVVTGVSAGTVTLTFTETATGCFSTRMVTVNALPSAPIVGTITQPTCTTPTGFVVLSGLPSGNWTITRTPGNVTTTGNTASTTISGLAPNATYTFTVTNSNNCTSLASADVVINAIPANPTLGGATEVCVGSTANVTPGTGGTWMSNNTAVATVTNAGVVTGVSAGTVTLTFTETATGCSSTRMVTVNALPSAPIVGTITQPTCTTPTGSVVLSGLPSGNWTITRTPGNVTTTGNTTSTTISGLPVSGTYTFTVTDANLCTSPASTNVGINAIPANPILGGATAVCVGSTANVTPGTGGTWMSSNTAIATVTDAGVVTGVSAGTVTLTFTETATGCFSTRMVTVNALPSAPIVGTITQPTCTTPTGSVVLSGLPSGNWTITRTPGNVTTTGNTASTTISGLAPNATYTFTVTNSNNCTSLASANVVINAITPNPTIGGATTVCFGITANVTPGTGGTWMSSNTAIATVTNAGVVTGVSAGTVTLTFTETATGCSSSISFTVEACCAAIETWVYLEGAAIATDGSANYSLPMRTTLNGLGLLPGQTYNDFFLGTFYTPAGQPYNGAPWNYSGTEGNGFDSNGMLPNANANYPSTVVDWVLVSLRNTPDGTGGPICQAAALLHNDGRIEFINDFKCCGLDFGKSYYVVIEHRNHLIVMSHQPVAIVNGKITYDFRNQQSYISDPFNFGTFSGQKQIQTGKYAMLAGNGNQTLTNSSDTDINFDDRTFWETLNGQIARYRNSDYNLNGDTNFNDRRVWELNNGKFTSVPRN
jgi:uncharacterized protein YjdB